MSQCLEEADSSSFTSIAFPALGTGKLGYNKHGVAEAMFTAVEHYSNSNINLRRVTFVIHPPDINTLKVFESSGKRTSGKYYMDIIYK